jgi:hypothetical protein
MGQDHFVDVNYVHDLLNFTTTDATRSPLTNEFPEGDTDAHNNPEHTGSSASVLPKKRTAGWSEDGLNKKKANLKGWKCPKCMERGIPPDECYVPSKSKVCTRYTRFL